MTPKNETTVSKTIVSIYKELKKKHLFRVHSCIYDLIRVTYSLKCMYIIFCLSELMTFTLLSTNDA